VGEESAVASGEATGERRKDGDSDIHLLSVGPPGAE
jgi:hypothetical protein